MNPKKKCSKCGELKPLSEFYAHASSQDGVRPDCKKCKKQHTRVYYQANREEVIAKQQAYYARTKEARAQRAKKWREENPEYHNLRYSEDPAFRTLCRLRTRLRNVLKGNPKAAATMVLVGCTPDELCAHLESLFPEGMTWENYGDWHIDHIRPCASFDLLDPNQQYECFHYTNLQPLWAEENLKKGDKILDPSHET